MVIASYTSIVRVAGYNSSAQLAGDSRNTRRMLDPGSVKALLHGTTCAVCSPLLLSATTWFARTVKNVATGDGF